MLKRISAIFLILVIFLSMGTVYAIDFESVGEELEPRS